MVGARAGLVLMSWATALASLNSGTFALFGSAATYTRADTGVATSLTAVLMRDVLRPTPDQRYTERRDEAEIRVSELTAPPARGDRLTIGSDTFVVDTWEADVEGTLYRCTLTRRAQT